jgi:hypothetical protein
MLKLSFEKFYSLNDFAVVKDRAGRTGEPKCFAQIAGPKRVEIFAGSVVPR